MVSEHTATSLLCFLPFDLHFWFHSFLASMDTSESDNPKNSRSSISRSVIDEPSSPYFLHHSDGPWLVLVSQFLTGDNYASWNWAMLIALSIKNKVGFIDGTITKPEGNDMNLLNSWIINNNVVIFLDFKLYF